MSDPHDTEAKPRRTTATQRNSRWPGWIWAVPIAAVGVATWLMLRAFSEQGIDVTVTFADAAEMKPRDTKVRFRGLDVGKVSSVELSHDRRRVIAHLHVDDSLKDDLTTGTRFYLQGGEPSLSDLSSLTALITGPFILIVPGKGAPTRSFAGFSGPPPEALAMTVPFLANFAGNVGQLKAGSPVMFRGFTVGTVSSVALSTDARTGTVSTPVVIALDPTRFHIDEPATLASSWGAIMRVALAKLVKRGLRARLSQSPPLVGSEQVELALLPDAPAAELRAAGRYLEIPTQAGGMADLPAQLSHLPIPQIAENVREITAHLKDLAASPQLKDSLRHLDAALAQLDSTLGTIAPQIGPTVASARAAADGLRRSADDIDGTAQAVRKLLGGSSSSPNGNLQEAVHELTGTARAIRVLANYLDQHPEALVRGRVADENREER